MHPRAEELVRRLELQPHPEGGFYREIFRSARRVQPFDARPTRHALTLIYFLLADGGASRWHRVASDEAWTWVEGDALELHRLDAALTSLEASPIDLLIEREPIARGFVQSVNRGLRLSRGGAEWR